ncbi:hypothetical protein HY490_05375 [Candidatus Woesearchaeota archaeon]|nr:hypothetical protein [Candidatus Woesearchaeota archaeon]
MKSEHVVLAVVFIVAIIAIVLLYSGGVTGQVASTQQAYGTAIPHTVRTNNPCKIVECGSATRIAFEAGIDEWGNVLCKCPGHAETFFAINPVRKY